MTQSNYLYENKFSPFSDHNDCDPNPCAHGACHDRVNDYECECLAGWEGKDCDIGKYNFEIILFFTKA